MKTTRSIAFTLFVLLLSTGACLSQASLSANWEELTGPDFIQAIHQSQGVCVLPFGIIEKHGAHLPKRILRYNVGLMLRSPPPSAPYAVFQTLARGLGVPFVRAASKVYDRLKR